MKRSFALSRIRSAGEHIALCAFPERTYSCNVLSNFGLDALGAHYWWVLMDAHGQQAPRLLLENRVRHELGEEDWGNDPEDLRAVRLTLLAWLHEMVRSGEFTRITGFKFST